MEFGFKAAKWLTLLLLVTITKTTTVADTTTTTTINIRHDRKRLAYAEKLTDSQLYLQQGNTNRKMEKKK